MSGSVLHSLNNPNIIFFGSSYNEEEEIQSDSDFSADELKALRRDKAFMRIWDGGIMTDCGLDIRSMITVDEKNRLYLNGRRFTRSSWSWRPPLIIRLQGRLAKDFPDPYNEHPQITIEGEGGKPVRQDHCVCGGELQMDRRGFLYCTKCNIIYE